MNSQELVQRNRKLERRWKIVLALAVLFIVTRPVALYIVNHLIHNAQIEATENNYPLIDPARQFISQENFIVNIQELRDYFNGLGEKYSEKISIYYEQLNSGANIAVNKDQRFFIASLAKLPVAMVVTKKVEQGMWNWDTKFQMQEKDLDAGSGELYKDTSTKEYPLKQLLEALLIDSDNTANNILTRNLTESDYQGIIDAIGLEDLFDANSQASAKEYSRLLRALYTSSYLERENSQEILKLMSEAKFKNFLSQGLPGEISFAHKYGENSAQYVYADSGIVYVPNKPYMITVIYRGSTGTPEEEKEVMQLMKEISEKAYSIGK